MSVYWPSIVAGHDNNDDMREVIAFLLDSCASAHALYCSGAVRRGCTVWKVSHGMGKAMTLAVYTFPMPWKTFLTIMVHTQQTLEINDKYVYVYLVCVHLMITIMVHTQQTLEKK